MGKKKPQQRPANPKPVNAPASTANRQKETVNEVVDTQNDTSNSAKNNNDSGQNKKHWGETERSRWLTNTIIDVIMAGGTIAALMFSYKANQAAEQSLKISRDNADFTNSVFLLQHRPFLQAKQFEYKYEINYLELKFKIHNLGEYPAQILNARHRVYFSPFVVDSPFTRLKELDAKQYTQYLTYVTKEAPSEVSHFTPTYQVPPKTFIDSVLNGRWDAYLIGEIFYMDEITEVYRRYRFYCRFKKPGLSRYDTYVNENVDIESSEVVTDLKSFGIDTLTRRMRFYQHQ